MSSHIEKTPFNQFKIPLVSIFFLLSFVVSTGAETTDVNTRISNAEDRIAVTEKKLNEFLGQGELDKQSERQKALLNLQEKLQQTAINLAGTEVSLSNHYIQIVGGLFLVAGVFSGIGVFVVKLISEKRITNIVNDANMKLGERTKFLSDYNQITYYYELSFTCWEIYEPLLKSSASSNYENAVGQAKIAKNYSHKGLDIFKNKEFTEAWEAQPEREEISRYKTHLTNDYVYHATMEVALPAKFKPVDIKLNQTGRHDILEATEKCIEASKIQLFKNYWYSLQETAAFGLVMVGNDTQVEEGKQLMKNLISHQTTVPAKGDFILPTQEWKDKTSERWKNIYKVELPV